MTFGAEEPGQILSQDARVACWCRENVVSHCWRNTIAAG